MSAIEVIDLTCQACGSLDRCSCSESSCEACGRDCTAMLLFVTTVRPTVGAYCADCAPAEREAMERLGGYSNLHHNVWCRAGGAK